MIEFSPRSRREEHLSRKLFHLVSGTLVSVIFMLIPNRLLSIKLIVLASLALIVMDFFRLYSSRFNRIVVLVYGPLMRENEHRQPSAQLYYVLGLAWAIVFLPRTLALQSILTLAWMDPLAALVGLRFGKKRWNAVFQGVFVDARVLPESVGAKTVEGSLAGFLAAFVAGLIAWSGPWASVQQSTPQGSLLWSPHFSHICLFSGVGALVAMIAEAWPSQWDDNINIPFWTGLAVWCLAQLLAVPLRYW